MSTARLAYIVTVPTDSLRNVRDRLKHFRTGLAECHRVIKRRHGRRVEHRTKRWGDHLKANLVPKAHEILHPQAEVVVVQ